MHDNPQPTERTCTKTRYASKREAQTVINRRMVGRQRRRNGSPDHLRAYYCEQCRAHHITHQEDWFENTPKRKGNPRRYRNDDPCDYDEHDNL